MSENHTPGPWKIQTYENYFGFAIYSTGPYGCVAERWYKKELSEQREAEQQANAQLITCGSGTVGRPQKDVRRHSRH